MIIVSNTSPISNLAQVGRLEILQQIYGKIIIPTAVYNELTAASTSFRCHRHPSPPADR